VVGRKVQDVEGGGGISQNLVQLLEVPGLQGVEGRVADGVVRVGSQQNQDLDLLVEGQGQASLGAFAPDELGGFPLA
jgi:hypothetical protein